MRKTKINKGGSLAIAAVVIVLVAFIALAAYYALVYQLAAADRASQETDLPGVDSTNIIEYILPQVSVHELYINDHDWQGVYRITEDYLLAGYTPTGPGDEPTIVANQFSPSGAKDLRLWVGCEGPNNISASKLFTFSKTDVVYSATIHELLIHVGWFAVSEVGDYEVNIALFALQTNGSWLQQGTTVTMTTTVE